MIDIVEVVDEFLLVFDVCELELESSFESRAIESVVELELEFERIVELEFEFVV